MADRNEALVDYKAGLTLKEIAETHGISESAVKSWASRYWKKDKKIENARKRAKKRRQNNKKSCNLSNNEKSQTVAPPKRSVGGQPGNTNAVGHGAPKGNTNAIKHGGYCMVHWEELSEEEREFVKSMSDAEADEEAFLEEQILLYSIREKRLLKAINSVKDAAKENKLEVGSNISAYKPKDEPKMKPNHKTSFYERVELATLRLEKELTSVQRSKTKTLQVLAEIRSRKGENNEDWLGDFYDAIDEVENEEQE